VDFVAVVDQVIALLRQRGRITYGALQLQYGLTEAQLAVLKDELLHAQQVARDEDGRILVWTGDAAPAPTAEPPPPAPLAYTPPYLAEKILTSRSALEGERKQVTVLFADLKGSMELLADRDPEEARQLLDPVLERMMAAVHRYEGTVNQVMGDGIMALFGAPLAHEDHAVRACYAALAMQTAVKQYAAEVQRTQGVPVQIRVGMHAGEVVVRAIGNDLHMDYSAIGQTTHLAARMEQMALPGSILITPAVLGLAEGYVQVRSLGLVPVRGLDAPVEVFELVGASGIRRRLQTTAARGFTRFVGRDTDNWLRVLDTAELTQIDHRIPQQLHPIVALLDAFKAEQQPLELIFPRKGPLDPHASCVHGSVEEAFAPTLGVLAVAWILLDIREQARVDNALAIVGRSKAAIEVKIGASEVHPNLFGHPLQRVQALWEQNHIGFVTGCDGHRS
jgi:class 3 adenylate cyclase